VQDTECVGSLVGGAIPRYVTECFYNYNIYPITVRVYIKEYVKRVTTLYVSLNATACLVLHTKGNLKKLNAICKLKFAVILHVLNFNFSHSYYCHMHFQ